MDLQKIRNMSDEELRIYLVNLSNRNTSKCSACNEPATKVVKIENKETYQTKKLCGICDECYKKLVKQLNTTEIGWND